VKTIIDSNPVNRYFLTFAYVLTVARFLCEAKSVEAEHQRIARIEAAKRAARDADEVAAYKLKLWFESHARHSFYESNGKISLRARSEGGTSGAPIRHSRISKLRAKLTEQQSVAGFHGTKYGRITSLPACAPYRRGVA
jgi:hypothetical protein